ncbi:MAG: lysophospholipid transporter LplT [Sulfuricaulis sp.]
MNSGQHNDLNLPLFSLPMTALLSAQFLSALADNALLVVAIALVKQLGRHGAVPLIQEFFVIPYILLAPFAGPFADSLPKGRVMFIANALKLFGVCLMYAGANPFVTYFLVGVGATAYSPAKYGILAQYFGAQKLVRANGMLEGSTIVAILLGVVLGGKLADRSIDTAFVGIIVIYAFAAAANLAIPRLPAEHRLGTLRPVVLVRDFIGTLRLLFAQRDSRFSLLGTSLFWGSGTTLRLLLFAWVPVALAINNNSTPANLMGVVSVGIVLGALLASWMIRLEQVNRALIGGLLLGPLVVSLAFVHSMTSSIALLMAIGASGGLFVVPLNALLQEQGHKSVGAGHALAVQNLCENTIMLLFVGIYSFASYAGAPVIPTVAGFGVAIIIGTTGITAWRYAHR